MGLKIANISGKYARFLDRLRQAQNDASLTQREVAKLIGKNPFVYFKSRDPESALDFVGFRELAKLYRKPISYFRRGSSSEPFREVLLPESDYWEACARHSNRVTTRNISVLFLCDECTRILTRKCFNGRPPIYHGDSFNGYCGLCNKLIKVALRQWFICPICFNVVLGYPKSMAAAQFVHSFWITQIKTNWPELELTESDIVQIEPFVPGKRSQKAKAITVENLDFLAQRRKEDSYKKLFHIEMKTGPSSISEMREFQLDVNDFNDIKTVVIKTGLPAYVFHIQVVEEYRLPTRRSIAKGMWWADIVSLRNNLKVVHHRRGENKDAGYYQPSIFQPAEMFVEEIKKKKYEVLAEIIHRNGLNALPSR